MSNKQELLTALEDSYKNFEKMYDTNLERMGTLHEQIRALKEGNTEILKKMSALADKIREVKDK
jgi:hypothetical protein